MFDLLIKNGIIVDGSGKPASKGDIAVKDGKIVKIAPCVEGEAAEVIDAEGHNVAPGFLDTHSHSDPFPLVGSDSCNYLQQGVTTQIAGQCGSSYTPVTEEVTKEIKPYLNEEQYQAFMKAADTPTSFMEAAGKAGIGTNFAFFIGQGQIRDRVMGFDGSKPTPEQMEEMKKWLREAMEAGFLGFSTGLVYAPSVYADTDELVELAKELVPYDGYYISHIRGEGRNIAKSMAEFFEIGERSGCNLWLSHFKVMTSAEPDYSIKVLKKMEELTAAGKKIYADQYPYNGGAAPLMSQLPPKYLYGGTAATVERLKDPEIRKKIEYSLYNEGDEFESNIIAAGFGSSLVVDAPGCPQYVNKTLEQIGQEFGKTPLDALCDILIESPTASGIYFAQRTTDLVRIMAHPLVFCGSDTADYLSCDYDPEQIGGNHPRSMGTTPRRIELVRDFRMRTMEECIKNISHDPAVALKLEGIGLLAEGYDADIVIFDYDKVHANADYMHPQRPNEGIYTVIVSGKVSVRDGKVIPGVRAGRILKPRKTW